MVLIACDSIHVIVVVINHRVFCCAPSNSQRRASPVVALADPNSTIFMSPLHHSRYILAVFSSFIATVLCCLTLHLILRLQIDFAKEPLAGSLFVVRNVGHSGFAANAFQG
jgi:hypothetical protein